MKWNTTLKQSLLFAVLQLTLLSAMAADYPLEIIELKSRSASEVIPLIKPFAGTDATVSGHNYSLFIQASPQNVANIRKMLAQIDKPAKRLMILVRQDRRGKLNDRGIKGSVTLGNSRADNNVNIQGKYATTRSDEDTSQHIQALEGRPAFIATGKAYPIPKQTITQQNGSTFVSTGIEYRNASTGFYVLPRVNNNQVILDISPRMERKSRDSSVFTFQEANTTVIGNLGEWISIAGSNERRVNNDSGILHHRATKSNNQQSVQVKVELIE